MTVTDAQNYAAELLQQIAQQKLTKSGVSNQKVSEDSYKGLKKKSEGGFCLVSVSDWEYPQLIEE